jgi:FemAB-related protein (PEP-CTERM system-associated)
VVTVAITDDDSAWNAYVSGHPDATAYHQWAWREVFSAAFGHACVYLVAQDGARITGVLPLVEFRSRLFGTFAVSLPFVNYGGVVADTGAAAGALSACAESLARERGWGHVELRHVRRQFAQWPVKRHKVAMWLSLSATSEILWSSLDRKVRNQVRKAEKSGCTAEHGGAELLDDFYRVFAHNMRDLGTPVYARRLFEEVLRAFPSDTRVFVVRIEGDAVAASITVGWRERIEVPWASSLRAHAAASPNTLLYWTMLKWAVEHGG